MSCPDGVVDVERTRGPGSDASLHSSSGRAYAEIQKHRSPLDERSEFHLSRPGAIASRIAGRKGLLGFLREELLEDLQYFIAHVPGSIGRHLRALYYSRTLAHLGRHAVVGVGMEIIAPENIGIGDDFIALRNCFLCADGGGEIIIKDRVSLATNAMINAGQEGLIVIGNDSGIGNNCVLRSTPHKYQDPTRPFKTQGHTPGTIIIEDDVWVAANVTVLPGTHIERGCIVSSGSVVGGVVRSYSVVAGNPARVVGKRE